VVDELRLLEYSQRLTQRRRNVFASAAQPDVAQRLWLAAADGGARAAGRPIGALEAGRCADFVVLDAGGVHAGLSPPQMLANAVFAQTGHRCARDVWVAGQPRIVNGRHALDADAQAAFVTARSQLLAQA
jgi:formimidoylglutamate deiminase